MSKLPVGRLPRWFCLVGMVLLIGACASTAPGGGSSNAPTAAVLPISSPVSPTSIHVIQNPRSTLVPTNIPSPSSTATPSQVNPPVGQGGSMGQSSGSFMNQPDVSLNDAPGVDTTGILSNTTDVTFSPQTSDHTRPIDVLREVTYAVGGGDSGDRCSGEHFSKPTVVASTSEVEVGKSASIYVCAWKPNEVVQVTLIRPNGSTEHFGMVAEPHFSSAEITQVSVFFRTRPDSALGQYTVRFEGLSGQVEHIFSVKWPVRPRVYSLDENTVFLYGFMPLEKIRVIAYRYSHDETSEFAGWVEYQADSRGNLVMHLKNEKYFYTAIGAESGIVEPTSASVFYPAIAITSLARTLTPTSQEDLVARVSNFIACVEPCSSNGSNATRVFPEGTTQFYLQWSYENVPNGSHYVRSWTMDGKEWIKYDCTWQGPESGTDRVTLKDPGGLHSGTWELTISVNDNVLLREQVVVEGNSTYWSPAGTFNSCYGK